MTPPPTLGGVIVTELFAPRSNELLAVIDPAPALVTRNTEPQSIVEADPTETVVLLETVDDISPTGALAVPVMVKAPVMVVVVSCAGTRVLPLLTVTEPNVLAPVMEKITLELLSLIVRLA